MYYGAMVLRHSKRFYLFTSCPMIQNKRRKHTIISTVIVCCNVGDKKFRVSPHMCHSRFAAGGGPPGSPYSGALRCPDIWISSCHYGDGPSALCRLCRLSFSLAFFHPFLPLIVYAPRILHHGNVAFFWHRENLAWARSIAEQYPFVVKVNSRTVSF